MGLFDIFKKKSVDETLDAWVEDERSEKIAEWAEAAADPEIRKKAIAALGKIKRNEYAVNTLMRLISDDNGDPNDIRIAACKSLVEIGTRREVDRIYQLEEREPDADVKAAMIEAAVASKERTPMFR